MLAALMFDRAQLSQDVKLVIQLAERSTALLKVADPRDRDVVKDRADALWELGFYLAPRADLLARVEGSYRDRYLAASSDKDRLHATIRIAAARAAFMAAAPSLERHTHAVQYASRAYELLPTLDRDLEAVPIGDRCSLALADLRLTNVHRDPFTLVSGFNRVSRLVPETAADWANSDCTESFHQMARNLQLVSEQTEREQTIQLLRLAVEIEKSASARDRTQSRGYNRGLYAIASARLALASGEQQDRNAAFDLLREVQRQAVRERNSVAQTTFAGYLAKLNSRPPF